MASMKNAATGKNETKPVKKITDAPKRRTNAGGMVKNATGATAHTAPDRTNAAVYPVPVRRAPAMQTMTASASPTVQKQQSAPKAMNVPTQGYAALMGMGGKKRG